MKKISTKEIAVLGMFGAVMEVLKTLMSVLPNIHFVGVIIVALTAVYRYKALFPIYVFVFLDGIFTGTIFSVWWYPYLYIWTILWCAVMLVPKSMSEKTKFIVYTVICSLHGFLFGILFAPGQALVFGLSFKGMLAWIAAGFPFDIIHGISNLICGSILIYPLVTLLRKCEKYIK